MKKGRARRELILSLVPAGRQVIDVGADHGHVAARIDGAIATKRMPHRRAIAADRGIRWVVADGLAPFRTVDVAIIAGMGSKTIEGILTRGPAPQVAILHAPDDPQRLRTWLGANGWRIEDEGLAPEGRAFAEVVRVVPGAEAATGLTLAYGPLLLRSRDPHLRAHLQHHHDYHADLARQVGDSAPAVRDDSLQRVTFLAAELARLDGD